MGVDLAWNDIASARLAAISIRGRRRLDHLIEKVHAAVARYRHP